VIASEGDGSWVEYAGGYSDMLIQRGPLGGQDLRAAKPAARASEKPKPTQAAKPTSRKLSFKDKHALETLPSRMAALEKEIARLNFALTDPDLYGKQPAKFAEATKALEEAQAKLAEAEEQWLTLEMLREELEGA
jgi:ATP-binding cassette subfamily F protein uup